jgi:predicted MFS family arabinose efflux permease
VTAPLPARPGISRGLTLLFAIAGGLAVGNLYYAQPLLEVIAADLHSDRAVAGFLVTATQLGYAVGIFLIVPLGDITDRRRLVPIMMLVSALALAGAAVSPTMGVLALALVAVGLTTVAGQILAPLAGDLADDASRGKTVGIVASGIITGILVSRTFSGIVAGIAGWRSIFAIAAVATIVAAALLYRSIPRLPPKETMSYLRLLRSLLHLVRTERTVWVTMILGAIGFAIFTMFWTALTFLLSGPPYDFSTIVIGLFGIAGLVGSLAAQGGGRLHDRGWSVPATGATWALMLVAWLVAGFGQNVIGLVIVAVLVLDAGVQGQNILNQSRVFTISREARSRLNTAYVTSNFIGGSIGSVGAALLWGLGGWTAVAAGGTALALAGLTVWFANRRGALVVPRPMR